MGVNCAHPSINNGQICLPVDDTPRIFLGFPLVGTENFSFPAIINSFEFTPTPNRDGVYLGQSDNDKANIVNQAIMEEACELLINLISFAASSGWRDIHRLANVPTIRKTYWLNPEWLRVCLKEQFVAQIRQTPVVINKANHPRTPRNAMLSVAETAAGVEALWDLLDSIEKVRDKLPRRKEAVGWWHTVKSWLAVYKKEQIDWFDEVIDGRRLASKIDEKTHKNDNYGKIEDLQGLLREDISAVEWLNQLHNFFNKNELREAVREYHIVLDQDDFLDKLYNLYRDQDIDEELKDIAGLLGWKIRQKLRDKRLSSLTDKAGKGDWENAYVIEELIKRLQKRAEDKPDDKFAKASVNLFAWIVGQKDWDRLRGFPVFAKEGDSDSPTVLYLSTTVPDSDIPMAPIKAWTEDLQPFHELFSSSPILAEVFFKAVRDLDVWRMLNEQGFIKMNMVIVKAEHFDKFYANTPLEGKGHRTANPVTLTDIADRVAIMNQVRTSRPRAGLFWRFLTEWLVREDSRGLEPAEAECECGETHRYFPAAWLVPLRESNWIRLRNSDVREYARAQPLADLLRDNGWEANTLKENTDALKLLEAIDVAHFDLLRGLCCGKR